ncbi:hypothetical protein B0H10DRAFT_1272917 [Mycena sp. CBHHK59/15]|nr:hypothetical protein B0H10DRAFT_1272917 [Mycena sp. CBHHK59/15]
MTSLGNIEATPASSHLWMSLHYPSVNNRALRLRGGSSMQSPRLLAEEVHCATLLRAPTALLSKIGAAQPVHRDIHLGDVGGAEHHPRAGGHGHSAPHRVPAYRHMAPSKLTSVNDDSIRTWTVSSAHGTDAHVRAPRCARSPAARSRSRCSPSRASSRRRGPRRSWMPWAGAACRRRRRHGRLRPPRAGCGHRDQRCGAWAGGGPVAMEAALDRGRNRADAFQSMLKALAGTRAGWDIHFVLATAEPDILVPLVEAAFGAQPSDDVHLAVDVFSKVDVPEVYLRITSRDTLGGCRASLSSRRGGRQRCICVTAGV